MLRLELTTLQGARIALVLDARTAGLVDLQMAAAHAQCCAWYAIELVGFTERNRRRVQLSLSAPGDGERSLAALGVRDGDRFWVVCHARGAPFAHQFPWLSARV